MQKYSLSLSRNCPLNSKQACPAKLKRSGGFTLLEILLVVGIIAILAGIVIIAINPSKQLATVRNTERLSDIKQVSNALQQYYIDNAHYPTSTPTTLTEICDTGSSPYPASSITCGSLFNLSILVPTYLTAIPKDSQATTTGATGYQFVEDAAHRIAVSAPQAELGTTIAIGNVTSPPVNYSCGDPTNASCWSTETSLVWSTEYVNTGVINETDGKTNTATLVNIAGDNYPAAEYCYALTEGDVPVGTWYLPSKDELWAGWGALGLVGFPSNDYWSSTEHSGYPEDFAWDLHTDYDLMHYYDKDSQYSVRCLR